MKSDIILFFIIVVLNMEYRYQLAHDKYKILYIQFLVIYSLFHSLHHLDS